MEFVNGEPGLGVEAPVVGIAAHHVLDRAPVGDIEHDDAHAVAAPRGTVAGEVPGGEGDPLVAVDRRVGHQVHQPPAGPKPGAERRQEGQLALRRGDVVERERRENQIEVRLRHRAEVAIADQLVLPVGIALPGQLEHRLRDVHAAHLEAEVPQEAGRAAGATAEIQGDPASHVALEELRQVPKGKEIRAREVELRVGRRPLAVGIDIGEGLGHEGSAGPTAAPPRSATARRARTPGSRGGAAAAWR